jgi:CMP-N,N'-diacetyllegionaminic acid synthase
MFLVITLARLGSQRLKNKNIKRINKKTLLDYTFENSIKSKNFNEIFFSSESLKINNLAKKIGYRVEFKRPYALSKNNVTSVKVLLHAIKKLSRIKNFDHIILLQPTSPFRNWKDIDKCIQIFKRKKLDSLISITKSDKLHKLDVKIKNSFLYKNFDKRKYVTRKPYYNINGAVYISKISKFLKNKSFFSKKTGFYIMSNKKSLDIDTEKDFTYFKKNINKIK